MFYLWHVMDCPLQLLRLDIHDMEQHLCCHEQPVVAMRQTHIEDILVFQHA